MTWYAFRLGEEKYKSKINQLLDTAIDIQKENSDFAQQNEEIQIKLAGLQADLKQRVKNHADELIDYTLLYNLRCSQEKLKI